MRPTIVMGRVLNSNRSAIMIPAPAARMLKLKQGARMFITPLPADDDDVGFTLKPAASVSIGAVKLQEPGGHRVWQHSGKQWVVFDKDSDDGIDYDEEVVGSSFLVRDEGGGVLKYIRI